MITADYTAIDAINDQQRAFYEVFGKRGGRLRPYPQDKVSMVTARTVPKQKNLLRDRLIVSYDRHPLGEVFSNMSRALEGLTKLVTGAAAEGPSMTSGMTSRRHLMVTRSHSQLSTTETSLSAINTQDRDSRPMGEKNAVSSLGEALDKLTELQAAWRRTGGNGGWMMLRKHDFQNFFFAVDRCEVKWALKGLGAFLRSTCKATRWINIPTRNAVLRSKYVLKGTAMDGGFQAWDTFAAQFRSLAPQGVVLTARPREGGEHASFVMDHRRLW